MSLNSVRIILKYLDIWKSPLTVNIFLKHSTRI